MLLKDAAMLGGGGVHELKIFKCEFRFDTPVKRRHRLVIVVALYYHMHVGPQIREIIGNSMQILIYLTLPECCNHIKLLHNHA